jgi:hypothetical protein
MTFMRTIKKILFIILLGFSSLLYSQENKFKLSVQSGTFNMGDYKKVQSGWNVGVDASYFLSDHFFLTAHYNYGTGSYYDDINTNFPNDSWNSNGTNANLIINSMGLLAGYSLPIAQKVNLSGQIGFSQFIVTALNVPDRIYYPDSASGYKPSNYEETLISAAFPVKLSVGFTPLKYLEISLSGGFYIEPDYDSLFVGFYLGPQLSVLF